MAEEENKAGQVPKKKKPVLLILIIVVLLAVGGAVGAYFLMGGAAKEEAEPEEEGAEETAEEGASLAAIVPLETFIVNLGVKGSFLKTQILISFAAEAPKTMERELPVIRDGIIRILSAKQAADILTPEGKAKLKEEILTSVREIFGEETVNDVYFAEFIVQ